MYSYMANESIRGIFAVQMPSRLFGSESGAQPFLSRIGVVNVQTGLVLSEFDDVIITGLFWGTRPVSKGALLAASNGFIKSGQPL